jgi:hypothetical protein
VTDLDTDGIGFIERGQRFAGAHESDATIRDSVARVAARFGFSVDSVTVLRVLGAAPAVVLTVPDIPAVASRFQPLEAALFGRRPRYQGFYLEVRGKNGKPYIRGSQAFRTGDGQSWVDPSLR